jgi:lipoprotein-releasing system permease protein
LTNDLPYELFIAVRYLLARRKQAFISVISLISTVGVVVGVMAVLIALALMTGLQGELRDRIVGSIAHVFVFKHGPGGITDYEAEVEKIRRLPRVVGAAPVVSDPAMIGGGSGGSGYITLKGIVPKLEPSVTRVSRSMVSGSLDALEPREGEIPGIVIGHELARRLGTFLGDTVEVVTLHGPVTPFGASAGFRRLKVVGVFNLGLLEFDEAYAFVHLEVAKRLLDKDRPDFIEVRVDDLFAAQEVSDAIPDQLGPDYTAQDWADMNQSMFSALWLEKVAIAITIGLIVMVAALNIIASLILLVMEKSRDIAILKTMGSSAASIRRIFMFQGLVIGVVGTTVGAVLGTFVSFIANRYKLVRIPLDVYQISYVPFQLEALDFTIVVVVAILMCFLATVYPSRQAAKLDPAQALRYQ